VPGCGWPGLAVVLDLGEQPLANAILKAEDLGRPEPRYPLAMAYCPECWLVQTTENVPPDVLFREYTYFSSVSDAFVEHSRVIAERLIAQRKLDATSLVIELASNDGYLLQHYARAGVPVLGIDPARNIAEVATARGVPPWQSSSPASSPSNSPRVAAPPTSSTPTTSSPTSRT